MTNLNNEKTNELSPLPLNNDSSDGLLVKKDPNMENIEIEEVADTLQSLNTDNKDASSTNVSVSFVEREVTSSSTCDVEEFIREQLSDNLKDRLFMLNVEKCLVDFIKDDKKDHYKFAPMNRYYRMFVHRIGEYFGLSHNLDQTKQCIIVNKIEKTEMPKENFQSIITNADSIAMRRNSSANSIHSIINNGSTSPGATNNNGDQPMTKHTILKREKNIDDKDAARNNPKSTTNELNRPKTFEEKSADYIRIKNRIFSNDNTLLATSTENKPNGSSTTEHDNDNNNNNMEQKFTILNRQSSNDMAQNKSQQASINQRRSINTNRSHPAFNNQSVSKKLNWNSSTNSNNSFHNSFHDNNASKNTTPFNHQFSNNRPNNMNFNNNVYNPHFNTAPNQLQANPQSYRNPHNLQQPTSHSQKSLTIAHSSSMHHQPHFLVPYHPITSNSMQEGPLQVSMQGLSQMHNKSNHNLHSHNSEAPHSTHIMPNHRPPMFLVNNNSNPNSNFIHSSSNNLMSSPSYKSQQGLPNPHHYVQQSSKAQSYNNQCNPNHKQKANLVTPPQHHQVPIFNQNFQRTNQSPLMPNQYMIGPYTNTNTNTFPLNQSMGLPYPQPQQQHLNQHHSHQQSVFSNHMAFQQALMLNGQNMVHNPANSPLILNPGFNKIDYSNQSQVSDFKKWNNKKNSQRHKNIPSSPSIQQTSNATEAPDHNKTIISNSDKPLINHTDNNKNPKQKQPQKKKSDQTAKKKNRSKTGENITIVKNTSETTGDSDSKTLSVQVYNIKHDLTKKMLQDLLAPFVISIEFKSKSEIENEDSLLLSTSSSDEATVNIREIDESLVDVFIKFADASKFKEALDSFNLNELDLDSISALKQTEESSPDYATTKRNNQPFFFRSLTIF